MKTRKAKVRRRKGEWQTKYRVKEKNKQGRARGKVREKVERIKKRTSRWKKG